MTERILTAGPVKGSLAKLMLAIGFGYKAGLLIEGIGLSKGLRGVKSIAGQARSHARRYLA